MAIEPTAFTLSYIPSPQLLSCPGWAQTRTLLPQPPRLRILLLVLAKLGSLFLLL